MIEAFFAYPLWLMSLLVDASGFQGSAYRAMIDETGRAAHIWAPTLIAFLAGVSEMAGQSVILVINRVATYRFIASLLFTGATYLLTALIWTLSALVLAPVFQEQPISWAMAGPVWSVICLSFAPRLLSVFAIAPYFGQALANILEVWASLLVAFGMHAAFGVPPFIAVVCAATGWIITYFVRSYLGHRFGPPMGVVRRWVSGSRLSQSPRQIIDELVKKVTKMRAP